MTQYNLFENRDSSHCGFSLGVGIDIGFPYVEAMRRLILITLSISNFNNARKLIYFESQVSKRDHLHDVFYWQRHLKYEQLKHCVGKTKTIHVVLQTNERIL